MITRINPRACARLLSSRPKQLRHPVPFRPFSQWHPRPTSFPRNPHPIAKSTQLQKRYKSFRVAARELYNEHPISFVFASFCIISCSLFLVYANYLYQSYIIGEFLPYPESVAVKLRRALYYSNHDLQPENAVKYYKQALQAADAEGMDPFSDAMLGVRFQIALFLETKIMQPQGAIDMFERLKKDLQIWVDSRGAEALEEISEEGGGGEARVQRRADRTRILGQAVRVSVKLGALYSRDDIMDSEAAEESLVWAVTTLLKEQARRERVGVKEGEGEWMNREEIGASLEALATHYTTLSRHHLATPLYLHALSLIPPKSCHAITLMTSLSASLIHQRTPSTPYDPPVDPAAVLANARTWCERAITTSKELISDPSEIVATSVAKETEGAGGGGLRARVMGGKEAAVEGGKAGEEGIGECQQGCAVAMYNLGRIAEFEGKVEEARGWYERNKNMSREVGFKDGVRRGKEALRAMDGVRK